MAWAYPSGQIIPHAITQDNNSVDRYT